MEISPEVVAQTAVTIAGLKYVGQPAAGVVKDFLGRMLAPSADALAPMLAEPILEWRRRRVEQGDKLVHRAAIMVVESGEASQPVPGRIFWPVLEKGSVEEDPELSERWAALLANASMRPDAVLPAFATILSELSPTEARLLTRVYSLRIEIGYIHQQHLTHLEGFKRISNLTEQYRLDRLTSYLNIDKATVELLCDNLERLALLGPTVDPESDFVTVNVLYRTAELSSFGIAFMEACSTPDSKD